MPVIMYMATFALTISLLILVFKISDININQNTVIVDFNDPISSHFKIDTSKMAIGVRITNGGARVDPLPEIGSLSLV